MPQGGQGYTLDQLQKMGAKPVSLKKGLTLDELKSMGAKPTNEGTSGALGFLKGAAKSIGSSIAGGAELASKANFRIPGVTSSPFSLSSQVNRISEAGLKAREAGAFERKGTAEKAGGITADIAQFIIPGGAALKAEKALTGGVKALQGTSTLAKAGRLGSAMAREGTTFAGVGAVQEGSTENIGTNFAMGAAMPVIGRVAAPVLKGAAHLGKSTIKFGTSQLTGLKPETITQIIKNPAAFSKESMKQINREGVAQKVVDAVEKRLSNLQETGKAYGALRQSGQVAQVPETAISTVLNKYGIGLKNGKLVTTAESVPLSAGDRSAIESFISQYGKEKTLSGNAFLNARKALSNLSKFDATKTDTSKMIARELRSVYDQIGKKQITGLSKLDKKYAPEVTLLNQVKRDLLKPDGSLKDNAISKIANLTGKGKEQVLARLEKISPGIGKEVNILKALEDITLTGGNKIGSYTRSIITGGAGFAAGGPLGTLAALLLTSPATVIPVLRSYGAATGAGKQVVETIIQKMAGGKVLTAAEKALVGSSIRERLMGARQAEALKTSTKVAPKRSLIDQLPPSVTGRTKPLPAPKPGTLKGKGRSIDFSAKPFTPEEIAAGSAKRKAVIESSGIKPGQKIIIKDTPDIKGGKLTVEKFVNKSSDPTGVGVQFTDGSNLGLSQVKKLSSPERSLGLPNKASAKSTYGSDAQRIAKARKDIQEARNLMKNAPDTADFNSSTKTKSDYKKYIDEVQDWIDSKSKPGSETSAILSRTPEMLQKDIQQLTKSKSLKELERMRDVLESQREAIMKTGTDAAYRAFETRLRVVIEAIANKA